MKKLIKKMFPSIFGLKKVKAEDIEPNMPFKCAELNSVSLVARGRIWFYHSGIWKMSSINLVLPDHFHIKYINKDMSDVKFDSYWD